MDSAVHLYIYLFFFMTYFKHKNMLIYNLIKYLPRSCWTLLKPDLVQFVIRHNQATGSN